MSLAACLPSVALAASLAAPAGATDALPPSWCPAGVVAQAPSPAPFVAASRPAAARGASAAQAPVQARPGGPESGAPDTDQTVDVTKGTRLVLTNQAGEVAVRAWDRDAVRVQASHSSRERVDIQTADSTLRVRARGSRGPTGLIDFTVTVPRWMPVNLSGTYLAATIEGTSAEVNVETVGGDLSVRGGSGAVSLRSIQGEIDVDGASGKLQATTVNDSIRLNNVSGDVIAETTNGDVTISGSRAASLEVSTVSGDVRFEGPTADRGTYRITTHNGDIRVSLGAQANATVFVRTFGGDFDSDFPVTLPDGMGRRGNKRFNFTLGSGSARVELQSFQGDIRVLKGPLAEPRDRRRRGDARRPQAGAPTRLAAWVDDTVEHVLEHTLQTLEQTIEHVAVDINEALEATETPEAPPRPPAQPAPPAARAPLPPPPPPAPCAPGVACR